ncbi:MAG: glycosyltransferase family 2 protein [bacterium]
MAEQIFAPCGAAALYNIEWLRRAGGFDESYFCYNEDTDLAFRMRLLGAACVHLDHCIVNHVGSGTTGSDSNFTVYHGHRNLVWTYFKNMPITMLWYYLPQHLVLNFVSILYYTLKGRPGVILRAKWHALLGLPKVIRTRRNVQKTKVVTNQALRAAMVTNPLAPYFFRDE